MVVAVTENDGETDHYKLDTLSSLPFLPQ
jgi:hypothetical protein